MRRFRWVLLTLVAVSGLPGLGCGPPAHQWSGEQYTVAEPGKDDHRCLIHSLSCDGRPYLVVWADGCNLPMERGLTPGSNVWGELTASDGRRVIWCCETGDKWAGQDGLFSINGVGEFRLSAGGLFLIHGRETPVRVEQVAANLSGLGLKPTPDELLRASAGDQRVATFHSAWLSRR